jgi:DnaK suppressor protein
VPDDTVRARLLDERARTVDRIRRLEEDVDAIVESGDLDPPDDEHDPEGHTIGFERAFAQSLLGRARRHLDDLELALQRIDGDRYGTCEGCGGPIPPERLLARPDTTMCVDCAARTSRRET